MVLLSDLLILFQRLFEWSTFRKESLQYAANEISLQRHCTLNLEEQQTYL